MNTFRHLISAAIITSALLVVSSAHALVVDFENYDVLTNLENTFVGGNINYDLANDTHKLIGETFGNGGITFSNGVLLQEPLGSGGRPIEGDGGNIYYGTAFSPSTSIPTQNYVNLLTISINSAIDPISMVQGFFVHGLNNPAPIDYMVSYFTNDSSTAFFVEDIENIVFDNGESVVEFGLDTMLASNLITKVTISAQEFIPDGVGEWDFLLASVSFGTPVPLPAALPLFLSALLGGFVAARQKKSSDT